jgi:hypothetical protein
LCGDIKEDIKQIRRTVNYESSSDKLEKKYFDYNSMTPNCPDNPEKIF